MNDEQLENFSDEQEARWVCLFEAVNVIAAKATQLGMKSDKFLKPLPIEKYVKERYPAVFKDLEYEKIHGDQE